MRWSKPKLGEVRERQYFAWFPVYVGRERKWLETVRVLQKWWPCYNNSEGWTNIEFLPRETLG